MIGNRLPGPIAWNKASSLGEPDRVESIGMPDLVRREPARGERECHRRWPRDRGQAGGRKGPYFQLLKQETRSR